MAVQQEAAPRELAVHLAQANNAVPYAFVRAKFEPGEVSDPWAVRFHDPNGIEVPYLVWDSISWKVAREGRADWGHRFAPLNHYPGASPDAQQIRARRLELAQGQFPELGADLAAREAAAEKAGDSVCAALYLLRYSVPAFGKEKLTLRVYPDRQVEPKLRSISAGGADQETAVEAGGLRFGSLPDELTVSWKGRELFHYAGSRLGDTAKGKGHEVSVPSSHADRARPFSIEIIEGIITKVFVQGQTIGRGDGTTHWQCTYWLFPEGGYAALEGFSLSDAEGYLGGDLSLSILQAQSEFQPVHEPSWEKPWWLHAVGDDRFVATHQFGDTPLAVGHANNPLGVGLADSFRLWNGKRQLGLTWTYNLAVPETFRLFHPRFDDFASAEVISVLATRLTDPSAPSKVPTVFVNKEVGSRELTQEELGSFEEAFRFAQWQPRVDWLYRQYLVGVGETATDAESAMHQMLGAAAGWIDRPITDEEIADLLAQCNIRYCQKTTPEPVSYVGVHQVLPYLAKADRKLVKEALRASRDPKEAVERAMTSVQAHIANGGDPLHGSSKGGGEGWTINPAYFAAQVPAELRFLEHFQLFGMTKYSKREYEDALLRWADYSLAIMGGEPLDLQRLRATYRSTVLNRIVMIAPLLLRAYNITHDEKYAQGAKAMFDEIMHQVETNPRGYAFAWVPSAKAEMFDTNYNPAYFERGITDFWTERQLDLVGRERVAGFTAAQARWLIYSGQFLDTFEGSNLTAIHNDGHGRPNYIAQIEQLLYDDYSFYRGLVGEFIRWAVIDDGASVERRLGRLNFYAVKSNRLNLFWSFSIDGPTASKSEMARKIMARWQATAGRSE